MDAPPPLPANGDLSPPVPRKFRWWVAIAVVLLAIPALLRPLGIPVYLRAIGGTKSDAAKAFACQIEQSVTAYYHDNQIIPGPDTVMANARGNVFATDSPEGLEVINVLAGHNPRSVKYLAFKEAKGGKDGATYDPTGSRVTGLYDPWGNPYMIVMDSNYEERVTVPLRTPVVLNGRRCAVYSAGPDGIFDTKDDIKTWYP